MALDAVVRSIVKEIGLQSVRGSARILRDNPDKFPMFSTVPQQAPSVQHVRLCMDILRRFSSEQREIGHTPSAIFEAFMNMYMYVGSEAIGALNLASHIEDWNPEHQARLRQLGLRSSFELDDEEGRVFIALTADRYPIGLMGRRNTDGDLFVSKLVNCPQADFAAAVEEIKEMKPDLILGSDAEELLYKMDQMKGVAPPNR